MLVIKTHLPESDITLPEIKIVSEYECGLDLWQGGLVLGRAVSISSRSVLNSGRAISTSSWLVKCLTKFVTSNGQEWVGLALIYHYLSMVILPM